MHDINDVISPEDQRILVNIAMLIDIGEYSEYEAIKNLDKSQIASEYITLFWMRFNDMTRSVAERLALTKAKMHLEKCYKKKYKKYSLFTQFKNIIRGYLNGIRR